VQQIEEGELPFHRLPTAANDVQVFPLMQSPLIRCGKLATNGCGTWFDNENGSVVNGATKDKIRALIATSGDDLLLAAPFDNQSLTAVNMEDDYYCTRSKGGPSTADTIEFSSK
jgi:hypothetical protein